MNNLMMNPSEHQISQDQKIYVAKYILKRVQECLTHAREKELTCGQTVELIEFELERINEEIRGLND